jgi:hypothetical protein
MPDAEGLHRCPVCFKGYKRREHLQRHRASHTSERPHRCIICNASFQRTDVLKRHLQTCDGAPASTAGRRRACDRCVRQKKACNSLQPCQNCEKRDVRCQYSVPSVPHAIAPRVLGPTAIPTENVPLIDHPRSLFPLGDVQLDNLTASSLPAADSHLPLFEPPSAHDEWLGFDYLHGMDADPQTLPNTTSSPASESRGYSFDFLYDFTSRSGLVSSFECATLEQRQQIVTSFNHAYLDGSASISGTSALLPSQNFSEAQFSGAHDAALATCWLGDPLILKLHEIVLLVKYVVIDKPKNSTVTLAWSSELERRCIDFFSPYRFAKFIELYWSVWHPNVTIVHRPTFDAVSSKSILLAAMALIGMFSQGIAREHI